LLLLIEFRFRDAKIQVYIISVKEYYNIDMKSGSQKINIETLMSGIYFVKITNGNGLNRTVKIVK
jgi:hypothetical protein